MLCRIVDDCAGGVAFNKGRSDAIQAFQLFSQTFSSAFETGFDNLFVQIGAHRTLWGLVNVQRDDLTALRGQDTRNFKRLWRDAVIQSHGNEDLLVHVRSPVVTGSGPRVEDDFRCGNRAVP